MDTTNKQRILAAVWDDPGRAFGGQWRAGRNTWEYITGGNWKQRGAVRLIRSRDGEGITVFFNHGSGRAGAVTDVFAYFADEYRAAGFPETLRALADVYGLKLEFTEQERQAIRRGELARDVAASLIEHLRTHPDGPTARYITETRRLSIDGVHFGELTPESLRAATDSLKQRGRSWDAADLEALGLTEKRARAGYCCVLPYYRNGAIQGFIYRNINPNPAGPKYLYSDELGRGGYCDRLEPGRPAVVVEGQLDAVRLIQQGVGNVIAMGGAKIGEEIARLLRGRGITELVYIPDVETDATPGHRAADNLKLTADAIRAFQTAAVEGEPVVKSLFVLDLPTPAGANAKVDADTFGADNPGRLPGMVEFEPVEAWRWEFERLREQAAELERAHRRPADTVRAAVSDIFARNRSPFVRECMRQYVGTCSDLAAYGVTPQALADLSEWDRANEYQNRVKAAAADLNRAVQEQANPETVGEIVRRLRDAQGANTRAEWEAQLSEPFEAELEAIREQPDTLKTCWELGNTPKTGGFTRYETVEFYPADISVFCAATSHGKTAVLFAAALDLLRNTEKTYLFVSCEENKRQLLERAINVYLPIDTTPTGKVEGATGAGQYCFIRGTRKKAIKAAIKSAPAPDAYGEFMGRSEHFEALRTKINAGVEAYGRNVRPRLRFVHTEASAESICANILYYVEAYRARGVDVGAVFVDYMQLLTTDARNYSRHDELKDICKALKDCAARVELPIIIAAQLNREVLRATGTGAGTPLDNITVANIGEGADIERIAHDIYLVWQTDKTPLQWYVSAPRRGAGEGGQPGADPDAPAADPYKIAGGIRSARLFTKARPGTADARELKTGYLYIEQLKARDGLPGGWGLLPFDGERGTVGPNDTQKMAE